MLYLSQRRAYMALTLLIARADALINYQRVVSAIRLAVLPLRGPDLLRDERHAHQHGDSRLTLRIQSLALRAPLHVYNDLSDAGRRDAELGGDLA
jgi:hypothetical protein